MHFPLQLAAQFESLKSQKQRLAKQTTDLRSLMGETLVPQLVEFELSKGRRPTPDSGATEISRARAAAMCSTVMDLDKAVDELDSADLLRLQGSWVSDPANPYRQSPGRPLTSSHQPVNPVLIPGATDRFFEWVRSPGFSDMHAIQQMTLSQMRLYEIDPFPKYSELTVSLFSYYFLLEGGYLVPLYEVSEVPKFYQALGEAFRFSSEALVRFNIQACQRAYEHVLGKVG